MSISTLTPIAASSLTLYPSAAAAATAQPSSAGTPSTDSIATTGSSSLQAVTSDLVALLKALASGNVSESKASLARLQADLHLLGGREGGPESGNLVDEHA